MAARWYGVPLTAVAVGLGCIRSALADQAPSERAGAPTPRRLAHAREELRAQGTASAAERERSRSAYRDLSGSSASRLARRVFGGYMHAPGWVPVAMAEGQRLGRYRSDSVVEIRNADGTSGGLVDSSLPLVAPDGAGIKKPVDLSLGVDDGALVPRNPLVGTRIGQEIADGIRIDKLGLRLPGERSSRTVVGGRVLFV